MNNAAGRPRWLAVFLLLTFLAGCAGTTSTVPSPEAETPSKPASKPARQSAAVPVPKPAPKPKPEPEINAPKAAEVIGWDTAVLNEKFGPASLVRRDLGAEIWQYRTEACVLFLFLYPVGSDSALRVEHLDARGSDAATDACLKSVMRRNMARG